MGRIWSPTDVGSGLLWGAAVAGEVSFFAAVVAWSSGAALLLVVLPRIDSLAPLSWGSAPTEVHGDRSVVVTRGGSARVEFWRLSEVLLLVLRLRIPWLLRPIHGWSGRRFCVDQRVD